MGTIDTRILPKGTAYVTDIGMAGPIDSVIGDNPEEVLQRFLTNIHNRLNVANGKTMLNAVLVDVNEKTGKANKIERIYREVER